MHASQVPRAVAAARSAAAAVGLVADESVVLQDSNRMTLRLLPCDVVARVAPVTQQNADFEVDVVHQLDRAGAPVAALDHRAGPQVHERDGFVVTLWTYHEPLASSTLPPVGYADALQRLHAGMRAVELPSPHFLDRVASARRLVEDPDLSPLLTDADRALLGDTLRTLGRAVAEHGHEQLLHGEPHPGNVLATRQGLLFIDFETCCRGPVEFDLAHAPEEVAEHYHGVDRDLLRDCRILTLAVATAWRWDAEDQLPDGIRLGTEWLDQIRTALERRRG
ncbi:phosphotransferase [Auraticoccus sp. F435]|uniref:Phosphotransferase n=1 Tax=Auraticoccus cholistanensis TaxID=2656650 RepID=A0A6A9V0Y5_9ACTN|nr:aminoglycoside phosphotransferase family protein [Auraticoccus cholistanensis]MVA76469.1 phosphotransferase [Auraticoccus cholistanensis]